MPEDNRTADLRDRIVGQRYYDKQNEESVTVVGLSTHNGKPLLALLQYDDGTGWDEGSMPNMLSPEESEQFGLEEGGIDSERYVPIGTGPSLPTARNLCENNSHEWKPTPDEIWPEGAPDSLPESQHPGDLYNQIARCKKCGLSGHVAAKFLGDESPWFCSRCDDVYSADQLSYSVEGWRDVPICTSCAEDLK